MNNSGHVEANISATQGTYKEGFEMSVRLEVFALDYLYELPVSSTSNKTQMYLPCVWKGIFLTQSTTLTLTIQTSKCIVFQHLSWSQVLGNRSQDACLIFSICLLAMNQATFYPCAGGLHEEVLINSHEQGVQHHM